MLASTFNIAMKVRNIACCCYDVDLTCQASFTPPSGDGGIKPRNIFDLNSSNCSPIQAGPETNNAASMCGHHVMLALLCMSFISSDVCEQQTVSQPPFECALLALLYVPFDQRTKRMISIVPNGAATKVASSGAGRNSTQTEYMTSFLLVCDFLVQVANLGHKTLANHCSGGRTF
eukprot:6492555-Amphidinium_carterae.4